MWTNSLKFVSKVIYILLFRAVFTLFSVYFYVNILFSLTLINKKSNIFHYLEPFNEPSKAVSELVDFKIFSSTINSLCPSTFKWELDEHSVCHKTISVYGFQCGLLNGWLAVHQWKYLVVGFHFIQYDNIQLYKSDVVVLVSRFDFCPLQKSFLLVGSILIIQGWQSLFKSYFYHHWCYINSSQQCTLYLESIKNILCIYFQGLF